MYNPYIVIPFAAWAITQLTKFAIAAFRGRVNLRYLYASGGMPSVHSAVVCSLATTALLVDGASSHIFGLTAIFAAIVMYDSFGVRRSSGEQAAAINMIISSLESNRPPLEQPDLHLREILGHKPKEVTVGALMGIALGLLFNYNHLSGLGAFLEAVPSHRELLGYLIFFAVVFVASIIYLFAKRSQGKVSRAWKRLLSRVKALAIGVLILGALVGLTVWERAFILDERWWPLFVVVLTLGSILWIAIWGAMTLPAAVALEANQERKDRWLKPTKKKRRKR